MTTPTSFDLPKAVSRMWTKQNIFHEIGHKIKYRCWCKCQQNMPTEQCQFEKEIFHWKKRYFGITIILLMYQSAILYKYKQNITFNVINLLKYIQKRKIHEETRGGSLFHGGSIFYYSILTPGSRSYAGQYPL